MLRARHLGIALVGALLLFACGPTADSHDPPGSSRAALSTAIFQDGVAPTAAYFGTRDTWIVSGNPTSNYGARVLLEIDGISSSGTVHALLGWNLSSISPGELVQDAQVTFHVTNITADFYEVFELLRPWAELEATWQRPGSNSTWDVEGASGALDRGTTVLAMLGPVTALGPYTFSFNAEGRCMFQRWIADPAANHGLLIGRATSSDGIDVASREAADPLQRPMLSLRLEPAGSGAPSACPQSNPDGGADAGQADAGQADAGEADAGGADAGGADAGQADAGGSDAGTPDAGPADAGIPDPTSEPANLRGWGCSAAGGSWGALALLGLLLIRRRS